MRTLFWLLTGSTVLFIPAFLASWAGLAAHLSPRILDASMLFSFLAAIALMAWMLVACIRDKSLSAADRLRWELLLAVGGPITAVVFLHRVLADSRRTGP